MNKTSTKGPLTGLAGGALEARAKRSGGKPGIGDLFGTLLRTLSARLKTRARAATLVSGLVTGMAVLAAGGVAGCQVHPDLVDLYRVPPAPTTHPVYDPEAHFNLEQKSQGEEPDVKHRETHGEKNGETHGEAGKQNNKKDNKTNL